MGHGSYKASDWAALRTGKGISGTNRVESFFTSSSALPYYNVKTIAVRESRDSADSPRSTPIIIGFDVTASMGYLAKELSVNAVNKTVTALYDDKPVSDPHVMCAAIGDSKCDVSPLQVTQFEADIRMISQLTELYLEGGGGGNNGESYHLLWYFAAFHTVADCFEKRRDKGFLFTIGDDLCHPQLTASEIRRVFGDQTDYPFSNEELIRAASEKYHLFHINIENGNAYSAEVSRKWKQLMPGHATVIEKKNIDCLSDLITAIIRVVSGMSVNEALQKADQTAAERIARAMSFIEIHSESEQKKKIISF